MSCSHTSKPNLAEQLLEAFKKNDAEASGCVSRDFCMQLFGRLGLGGEDGCQLIDAWKSVSKEDADECLQYGPFIRWLVGTHKAEEILDAGVDAATSAPGVGASGGFGNWMDRCARVLETRDEADFVQKKLIAAQVRLHLQRLREHEAASSLLPPPLERSKSRRSTKQSIVAGDALGEEWNGPELLQRLLKEGPGKLPIDFVEHVLESIMQILPTKHPTPVSRLRVPKEGRVVVVGDTHGQLQDVLLLLILYGVPTSSNIFLFNGDVADRGPNACEIFMLIFVFFLHNPGSVLLTRGNHEDEQMNMMQSDEGGGFYDECLQKYNEDVFFKFVEVFKLLPLACVVHDEVFVVHGGLPSGPPPSIEKINAIKHTGVCCPAPDAETPEERLFLDLLWSDPREASGSSANPRGAGSLWGPDVTKAFLAKNNLRWIIRSHEVPHDYERGWMEHHLGLVFTVFSASNYCGYEVNWGAVALLTLGADGRVEQALREQNIPGLDDLAEIVAIQDQHKRELRCQDIGLTWIDSARVAVGERRVKLALRRLAGMVLEFKPELWKEFRSHDPKNTGCLSLSSLVKSLVNVCGEDLPWEEASKIWFRDNSKVIDYRKFLDRFKVVLPQERWCGWKSLVIADVYEKLLNRNAAADEVIHLFDPTGAGIVSEHAFMALIAHCSGGRLSESQVAALSRTIFAHACDDGFRLHDFLSRFTLAYVQSKGMALDQDARLSNYSTVLDQIGKLIARQPKHIEAPVLVRGLSHPATSHACAPLPQPNLDRGTSVPPDWFSQRSDSSVLMRTFEKLDVGNTGFVRISDFVRHIMSLPGYDQIRHDGKPLDEKLLQEVAQALADSQKGDGTISLLQFAQAFVAVDASSNADIADDLHEHILTFLYRHRHTLRSSCSERDTDATGRVSKKEFAQVLEAVHFCVSKSGRLLTRAQMDALVESIVEEDGHVEYEAFLSSFEVFTD